MEARNWGSSLLWAAGAALLLATPARAQEWTRFRGPNGTGIGQAPALPAVPTEADVNWKVQLPGTGHSSPVLWGDKIFLTSAEEETGVRHVLCVGAKAGQILWDRKLTFTKHARHEFNSFASSTPTVDADYVYAIFSMPDSETVYAFGHSGKQIWSRDLGEYPTQHSGGVSPIVVGDILIVTKGPDKAVGFVAGLDRKTGEYRWKVERPSKNATYGTPLLYTPPGGAPEVVIVDDGVGFTSLDPKTGGVNWELRDVFKVRVVASPVVVGNGLIFAQAGAGGGDRQTFVIQPGSKAGNTPAKVAYQVLRGTAYVPTPVSYKDRIYIWGDAGIVTCLKADTGETVWSERVGGNFFSSPVCVNGRLYCLDTQGNLVVLETGDEFKLLGKLALGELSRATPAIAGGAMYVRTESHLLSLGGKKSAK